MKITLKIFVFILLNSKIAFAQDSIFLKLKLVKGATYEYIASTSNTVKYKISLLPLLEKELKVTEQDILGTSLTVSGIDSNGNYILAAINDKWKTLFDSHAPLIGEVQYDSDNPTKYKNDLGNAIFKTIGPLHSARLYHPYKVIVSPSGRVISVTGTEKMLRAVKDSIQNLPNLSEEQKRKSIEGASKDLSNESVRIDMNGYFDVYLDHPITVGSRWERTVPEPGEGIYQYQLKDIRNDSLFIDVSSDINFPGDTTTNGIPTKMAGTFSGIMIIDRSTGMVLQYRGHELTEGTTVIKDKAIRTSSSSEIVDTMIKVSGITKKDP